MVTYEELREEIKGRVMEKIKGQVIEKIERQVDGLLEEPEIQEQLRQIAARQNTQEQNQSSVGIAGACED